MIKNDKSIDLLLFSICYPNSLSHDLTVKNSGAVFFDLDVLPVKTICCDIREDPVSILLIQELSDEPVTFLGKSEPFSCSDRTYSRRHMTL